MATKLKIDLSQGVLEVEGSETFVKAIYNDFKAHFIGLEEAETAPPASTKRTTRRKSTSSKSTGSKSRSKPKASTSKPDPKPEEATPDSNGSSPDTPRRRSESAVYSIVEDLELGATEKHPSVVEFMDNKFPITNEERNIVFLYFLENMLDINNINLNHIYSCYRAVNIRAPQDIQTSLRNTAKNEGWLTWEDDKITLTDAGRKYVENKLPKRVKS